MATNLAVSNQGWSFHLLPDPTVLDNSELLCSTLICAYILYAASNMISDGSEFLLLVPAVAGLVGSVVLPILGAVPDGMMVLFSATGDDVASCQESLKIGVGALAGSSIMLLTLPWFICIIYGRAPIGENGKANYDLLKGLDAAHISTHPFLQTGITVGKEIPKAAVTMILTSFLFLVIQIPAIHEEGLFAGANPILNLTALTDQIDDQDKKESLWAIIGLVASVLAFAGYLYMCYVESNEEKAVVKIIEAIQDGTINIGAALSFLRQTPNIGELLLQDKNPERKRLAKVLRPFFSRYDLNGKGTISLPEFKVCLMQLGENPEHAKRIFDQADTNHDHVVSFDEFTNLVGTYLIDKEKFDRVPDKRSVTMATYGDSDEEEEEMPEELHNLSPEEQQSRILRQAFIMMGSGTALVLIFSDPMVDILGEIGKRVGVSPFYISFVLAPLASNASELLAAYNYAKKQTVRSLTTSLSTLLGAACMNNTFCMAIFLFMVWKQGLAWQFTAETIATMLAQWVIGAVAYFNRTQTTLMGFAILAVYPLSLIVVWFLETILLMD